MMSIEDTAINSDLKNELSSLNLEGVHFDSLNNGDPKSTKKNGEISLSASSASPENNINKTFTLNDDLGGAVLESSDTRSGSYKINLDGTLNIDIGDLDSESIFIAGELKAGGMFSVGGSEAFRDSSKNGYAAAGFSMGTTDRDDFNVRVTSGVMMIGHSNGLDATKFENTTGLSKGAYGSLELQLKNNLGIYAEGYYEDKSSGGPSQSYALARVSYNFGEDGNTSAFVGAKVSNKQYEGFKSIEEVRDGVFETEINSLSSPDVPNVAVQVGVTRRF